MRFSRQIFFGGAFIALAALAAYHGTFTVPFLFDDEPSILNNPSITQLWPLGRPLSPPAGFGLTVSGRPLVNLSLAINYAISGFHVWSYHAFNLLVHVLAGLTLFGLARRTLLRSVVTEKLRQQALPAAFVLALLWTLHPLQTESVTYIVQRAESLMGWFFLLTLYGFARSFDSTRPAFWRTFSLVACALGMGCKEVMATAPVIVLLYDRTFMAGSFRGAWRERRGFYLGLAAAWLPLAWLNLATGGDRGGTFNFSATGFVTYWLRQFEAIVLYVKLSFWPSPLIFDYGWFPLSSVGRIVLSAIPVGGLLAGTLWALRFRPVAGFLGAAFFVILAPSSVMPGTIQIVVEHRMYLPLAAVLSLAIGGVTLRWGRGGVGLGLALALAAGTVTAVRNHDYRTALNLWQDTVEKRPGSSKAQANLGKALYERARYAEAAPRYQESIRLDPSSATTHFDFGLVLEKLGRTDEAIVQYTEAVRILPNFVQGHVTLGAALMLQKRFPAAVEQLTIALNARPDLAEAHFNLGLAAAETGQWADAFQHYAAALRLQPNYPEAEVNWGNALFQQGRAADALPHVQRAIQLKNTLADAHYNLGLILTALGRADEAIGSYAEAVRLDPEQGEARLNLGIAFAQRGRLPEAMEQLKAAVRLRPNLAEAHANLGIAQAEAGALAEAVQSYETALRLRPTYAVAHYNLGNALARGQRFDEARSHFAEALRLRPDFTAAKEMLDRLTAVSK